MLNLFFLILIEITGGYVVAGALLLLGVAAYALGRGTTDGSAAYSGTTAEVVGASFAASATVVTCFLVVEQVTAPGGHRALRPLLATGRLALTAYTVQILWLALLAALRDDAPQDSWWVLGSSLVVVIGLCWWFDRRWGTGPLEWVLHRLRPQPPPPGRHLSTTAGRAEPSVGEVPGAGEVHRHPGRLRRLDDLVVAHRPAGVHDRPHTGVDQHLQAVGEREERVGRRHRAARPCRPRATRPGAPRRPG